MYHCADSTQVSKQWNSGRIEVLE